MTAPLRDPRAESPPDARWPEAVLRDEPRNMAAMALSQMLMRTGWIFKTESVIVPAFLDSIAGAGWLRGLLPVLNRLGQSLAPFLLARRLKLVRRKKYALLAAALAMSGPFLLLAWTLQVLGPARRGWYPVAFLALYTVFFAATGLNMLSTGTLSGKLIRSHRRGRFLAIGTMGGTLPACLCAWYLLPGWLSEAGGYAKIFGFAGALFAVSAFAALWVREPPDRLEEPAVSLTDQLRGAWQILARDRNYRLLVIVSALFTTSLILLPHYQALGRERLALEGQNLMSWVVWQNVAVGLASVVMGPVADRYGNRLSLRIVIFASAAVPPFALGLTYLPPALGRELFTWVFVGIGITPIAFRLATNYVLEIAPSEDHPRYLSLQQVCTAAVILSSPIFGLLVDVAGFEGVFLAVTGLVLVAGVMTYRLVEPRAGS